MPRFQPFRGVRYDPARRDLEAVTAPPYDVIDADDRANLVARDPANVVRIDLPIDEGAGDPYDLAAELFSTWQREEVLIRDADPAFYVYRMDFADDEGRARHTTGVLGALELTKPGETPGGAQPILPHEFTTPKAKSDRLQLQRSTQANLSPVWGLSPSVGLTDLLACAHEPEVDFVDDDDDIRHRLWIIDEPERLAAIAGMIEAEPVVIADGHHRYETALTYRSEVGEDGPAGADAVLCWVVELADDELTVEPIHRLVSGLPDGTDVAAALAPAFTVGETVALDAALAARMRREDVLVLVEPDGARVLQPNAEALAEARALDTSRLDVALAAMPPHELVFQHGIENVAARVSKGDAQFGVLLRAATVAQIVDIAHGGERMPPKTTFFYPKPRTGMVFRLLDE